MTGIESIKDIELLDIMPELPNVLMTVIETKENLKEEIKKQIMQDMKGPQYSAVRVCKFPIDKDKESEDMHCEHYQICSMYTNNITEVIGMKCPFEVQKVEQLTNELIQDLEIDIMNDHNDRRMLGELVTYSLIEDRAIASLATSSLQMTNVTYGKGTVSYERVQNIHLATITQMNKLKITVREKLIATKSDRVKMNMEKAKVINSGATQKLREKIKNVEQKLKPKGGIGLINLGNNSNNFRTADQSIHFIETNVKEAVKEVPKPKQSEVETINFADMFGGA